MRTPRILASLVMLLGLLTFAPSVSAEPRTTVTPSIGQPGTRFLFFASEFGNRERLSFWLNRPDGQVEVPFVPEEHRANSNGDAVWTWQSPNDAQRGTWQMVAHGRSGTERVITFTIGDPPPPDPGVSGGIEPRVGKPGNIFRFFATGFTPGEFVIVEVSGPNGTTTQGLQVAQPASPDGRIDGSWNSPGDAPTGAWQIIARGDKSGVVQTLNFTLEGPTVGAGPQMDVSPTLGRPGMRFVISGSGFAPNEDISIWLNLPDGTIATTTIEGVARSGPTGRIAWTWVAPEDAQPGTWQMVAHGKSSGLEAVGTFTIER